MEQYIPKSAVLAEIERIMAEEMSFFKDCCKDGLENTSSPVVYTRMEMLLSFLNTLEVKEVDLEKEFNNYAKNILACDVQFKPFTHLYNCAKYFYELGLKAQKGE